MTRLLALAGLLLATGAARAQAPDATPLPLADQTLAAANGSSLTLGSAAGPEGLVVLFWSTACPWTERYAPRVSDLVSSYAPAGVGFVLVNSDGPVATTEAAASEAAMGGAAPAGEKGERASLSARRRQASSALTPPYVDDADGSLAGAFGARSTPHVFFFGPDQTLVYDGAIDDSPADAGRARVSYLQQAMDQSIAGIPVEVMKTQAFGCTIKARP